MENDVPTFQFELHIRMTRFLDLFVDRTSLCENVKQIRLLKHEANFRDHLFLPSEWKLYRIKFPLSLPLEKEEKKRKEKKKIEKPEDRKEACRKKEKKLFQ